MTVRSTTAQDGSTGYLCEECGFAWHTEPGKVYPPETGTCGFCGPDDAPPIWSEAELAEQDAWLTARGFTRRTWTRYRWFRRSAEVTVHSAERAVTAEQYCQAGELSCYGSTAEQAVTRLADALRGMLAELEPVALDPSVATSVSTDGPDVPVPDQELVCALVRAEVAVREALVGKVVARGFPEKMRCVVLHRRACASRDEALAALLSAVNSIADAAVCASRDEAVAGILRDLVKTDNGEADHPCFQPGPDLSALRDCSGDGWFRCRECGRFCDEPDKSTMG